MAATGNLLDLFLDNFRKLFYPEEWIALDLTLSKTEMYLLLMLQRDQEIIMSRIADYINAPLSTATGIVDRLVNKGYLLRGRSDSDRRIVVIRLTEKGQALVDSVKLSIMNYMERIEDSLTEEERRLLYKLFFKIIDLFNKENLEKANETKATTALKKIIIE